MTTTVVVSLSRFRYHHWQETAGTDDLGMYGWTPIAQEAFGEAGVTLAAPQHTALLQRMHALAEWKAKSIGLDVLPLPPHAPSRQFSSLMFAALMSCA
jgi:hypothetical protein